MSSKKATPKISELDIDIEIEKYELQLTKHDRINSLYDQLAKIYDQTIGSYQRREHTIYNPYIFRKITKQMFIQWVIDNNPDLESEIEELTKELN